MILHYFQGLLVVYLVVVIVLVKRQIRMVEDDDEEERGYVTKEDRNTECEFIQQIG